MKKINFKENWAYFAGILIGIGIVIVGYLLLTEYKYYGDYPSLKFGADFYTEIHKATVSVENSLRAIYKLLRIAIGWSMIGGGLTEVVLCGNKLRFYKHEKQKDDNNTDVTIDTLKEDV